SAWVERRPRGVQSLLLMRTMSGQPSPSASRTAQPLPIVSGSHRFPALPELWVKSMPAVLVTSVNWMFCAAAAKASSRKSVVFTRNYYFCSSPLTQERAQQFERRARVVFGDPRATGMLFARRIGILRHTVMRQRFDSLRM